MQIDVVIIKKCNEDAIHKNIGRIFRKYNIVEYKSPTDYLSIDDIQSIKTVEKLSIEYVAHEHNELYKSMMNIIIRANREKFEEAHRMCEALRELFADELETTMNKGIEIGRSEGIRCMIISSKEFGVTAEQIQSVLVKNYELDEEQAKKYIEQYWQSN